jgi:CheY-like chemotaxis protein
MRGDVMRQEENKKRLPGEKRTTAKTILVVEDDEDTQEFLTLLFTSVTVYHYQLATNASQAVDSAKRIKPDLFIVDYQLTGMNGLELYDLLHATPGLEGVPVLLLTATKLEALRPEIEKRQISALEKPFDLDELLFIVQRMLGDP